MSTREAFEASYAAYRVRCGWHPRRAEEDAAEQWGEPWVMWQAATQHEREETMPVMRQALQALEHCRDWLDDTYAARSDADAAIGSLAAAIRNREGK